MFGNKYKGADIAAEMYKLLNGSESDSRVKTASEEGADETASSLKAEAIARPEDFLVPPESGVQDVGASLEGKITDMSAHAEDFAAAATQAGSEPAPVGSAGSLLAESLADDSAYAEDISYLVDARAKAVLEGLGKVAMSLYKRDETFAADLVNATAMGIRQDYVEKAAKKMRVVDSLTKMASDLYSKDNQLAGDMVTVTIEKIKRNS